jgi:hypothetical protein
MVIAGISPLIWRRLLVAGEGQPPARLAMMSTAGRPPNRRE